MLLSTVMVPVSHMALARPLHVPVIAADPGAVNPMWFTNARGSGPSAVSDASSTVRVGIDTLIDVGNTRKSPEDTLVEGTRRILETCANRGVGHYVGISIVGCEKVDIGYYKAKTAQEAVIRSSPVGWSLLRATQFHELIEAVFRGGARRGVTPRSSIPLQTVAASEAAQPRSSAAAGCPVRRCAAS